MKKLLIMVICIFCIVPAWADPQQTINNEQGYALLNIEKVTAVDNKQSIKNSRSWFCINIIINGKIKDNNSAVQAGK